MLNSMSAKTGAFLLVVGPDFAFQVSQGGIHELDERLASRVGAAQAYDGLLFRAIIAHHQHFAVSRQPGGRSFDDLVGRLPDPAIEDLHAGRGGRFLRPTARTRPVKHDRDRSAGDIVVLGEPMNKFLAGYAGVTGTAGR